jgi:hypothetical protein
MDLPGGHCPIMVGAKTSAVSVVVRQLPVAPMAI